MSTEQDISIISDPSHSSNQEQNTSATTTDYSFVLCDDDIKLVSDTIRPPIAKKIRSANVEAYVHQTNGRVF